MGRDKRFSGFFGSCVFVATFLALQVAATAGSKLSAPSGLKATLAFPQVLLTWNASSGSGIIGYSVYRSLAARNGYILLNDVPTPSTSYADSPGVVNTRYYYKVAAVTGAGTGPACAAVSISFFDNLPPVLSSIGAQSLSGAGAVIVWATDEPATSQVDYGPSSAYGQSSPPDSSLVTTHAVTLAGLAGDTLYHYRVRSVDAQGNPAVGADLTFSTLDLTPPGNVQAFSAVAGNGQISLGWSNPATADFSGTRILFSTAGYPATALDGTLLCDRKTAPGASDSFVHTGLDNGVTYYYSAFAHDEVPNFATGSWVAGSPAGTPPPLISGLKPVSVGSDQANIEWTTDRPATTEVEFAICGDSDATLRSNPGYVTAHTITINGLSPGARYCYRAISRDAGGAATTSPTRSFRTAGGDLSGCLSCHDGTALDIPATVAFATEGHGKAGLNLICLDCHRDHLSDPSGYRYLRTVNSFFYPDPNPGWAGAVATQRDFCNLACHSVTFLPASGGQTTHPVADVSADSWNPFARACQGGATVPGPELPLLDADLDGAPSCEDIIMCVTCHTPHGKTGSSRMLREGSGLEPAALCTKCHAY